jgi:hypothetical protein
LSSYIADEQGNISFEDQGVEGQMPVTTKVFYFFCEKCGGDTATYELSMVCPYCHAGREHYRLVGEAVSEETRAELQQKLEAIRSRWKSANDPTLKGRKTKRKWTLR